MSELSVALPTITRLRREKLEGPNNMMTSETRRVTGGVDTHDDVHVAAVCDNATGRPLDTASFPRTTAGYTGLLAG